MESLQIEDFLNGAASGTCTKKIGSQFGSLWGWDGLMVYEATPEQYAAFGNLRYVKLCHSSPVSWLGQTWSSILTYNRELLNQINIHTDVNDKVITDILVWLEGVLGKGQEVTKPQDRDLSIQRRIVWIGRGGTVTFTRTPVFMQLSIESTSPPKGPGCFGVVAAFLISIGVVFVIWV